MESAFIEARKTDEEACVVANDSTGRVTLQRTELFEMVWREPLSKIAPRLGISDVGLAKACKRHNIPVPPRGCWAKLQHGKRVPRKPKLSPSIDGDERVQISLSARGGAGFLNSKAPFYK